jgi:hypothetical protein
VLFSEILSQIGEELTNCPTNFDTVDLRNAAEGRSCATREDDQRQTLFAPILYSIRIPPFGSVKAFRK